jgi:putative endonuclease
MAKNYHSTLYTGVTSDLIKRIYEHKNGITKGFTHKYGIKHLVYFELHDSMENAIHREKIIKKWKRSWKYNLIEKDNPEWKDLYNQICGEYQLPDPATSAG